MGRFDLRDMPLVARPRSGYNALLMIRPERPMLKQGRKGFEMARLMPAKAILLVMLVVLSFGFCVGASGCFDNEGLREVSEGVYVPRDKVNVRGIVLERLDNDEYRMRTSVFGDVLLQPKFMEGLFLKPGSIVDVSGYWEKPVGAPAPMIVDAEVDVIRKPT